MNDAVDMRATPNLKVPPTVCTVLADGTVQVSQDQIPLFEVQRLLLTGVANTTTQFMRHAARLERLLTMVHSRFDLGPDLEQEIVKALQAHPVTEAGPAARPHAEA